MKKIILLSVFILIIILLSYFGIADLLTLENIQSQKEFLTNFAQNNYLLFVLIFILIYLLVVTFQVPGAAVMTLTGGAIFGPWMGTLWINIGAATGALLAFLMARYLFQDAFNKKFGERLKEFNKGVAENGFNYILFLRLMPLFPFFLINLLAGLTKLKTRDYYLATVIGIIPGSFVYCNVGSALWQINSIKDIVSGQILLAFGLLGVLALIPVIYKKFKRR